MQLSAPDVLPLRFRQLRHKGRAASRPRCPRPIPVPFRDIGGTSESLLLSFGLSYRFYFESLGSSY